MFLVHVRSVCQVMLLWACILHRMSTKTGRTPNHRQGQRTDQPQIAVCMPLSSQAQLVLPLLVPFVLDTGDEDCDRLVAAGLGEIGHGDCETASWDDDSGGDAVVDALNRRMPT